MTAAITAASLAFVPTLRQAYDKRGLLIRRLYKCAECGKSNVFFA